MSLLDIIPIVYGDRYIVSLDNGKVFTLVFEGVRIYDSDGIFQNNNSICNIYNSDAELVDSVKVIAYRDLLGYKESNEVYLDNRIATNATKAYIT